MFTHLNVFSNCILYFKKYMFFVMDSYSSFPPKCCISSYVNVSGQIFPCYYFTVTLKASGLTFCFDGAIITTSESSPAMLLMN